MAASKEIVYIKADRNVEVADSSVKLGDVLSMECANPVIVPKLKTIKLLRFHEADKKMKNRVAVSILKVIECIHAKYPEVEVRNLGEQDFIVTYEEQSNESGIWYVLKTIGVVLISFMGAAFSIMAFNNDVGVTKMFNQIYELVTGVESDGFTVLEFAYSIGITIGILTFFNHFGKKKFSVDPTPIEVEMRLYENDLQTTLIENISRKEQELDVGSQYPTGSHRT